MFFIPPPCYRRPGLTAHLQKRHLRILRSAYLFNFWQTLDGKGIAASHRWKTTTDFVSSVHALYGFVCTETHVAMRLSAECELAHFLLPTTVRTRS